MSEPMATAEPGAPFVVSTTSTAPARQPHETSRCCALDRDAVQPQSARTLATHGDWSADLQSERVPLHAAATLSPRPMRDPVPLPPSSTARHVLLSVFLV